MAKRRRSGEGSVYQRESDGAWLGVIDLGWQGGKRVRRSVSAKTEREAIRKLRQLRRDVDDGLLTDRTTVDTWVSHYLDGVAPDRKPTTMRGYRDALRNWIAPTIGGKQIAKLTVDDVRGMHAALRDRISDRTHQPLSPTTIRLAHTVLRLALDAAMAEGRVARNVASIAGAPSPARNPYDILSADQAMTVIRSTKDDPRRRCRVICALVLGVRPGEILRLRWSDVAIAGATGTLHVRGTKTERADRVIPLPALAAGAFTAWQQESGGSGYVFPDDDARRPVADKRDWEDWRDTLRAAGVPHIPRHGARGSAGTLLQSLGVPDRVIADILGHAQVRTSQEHYLRSDEAQRLAALELAAGALDPQPVPAVGTDSDGELVEVRLRLPASVVARMDELAADADVSRSVWVASRVG